jgi:hypothetical protein
VNDAIPAPARSMIGAVATALGMALGFAILLYLTVGATLGLYFGGIIIVTILLPPLVLMEQGFARQALIGGAITDAVAAIWLVACVISETTLLQWLRCYFILLAYAFALWGLVRALRATGLPAVVASGLGTIVAALWLSWPIWLARYLLRPGKDALVDWLIPGHPFFVLNGILSKQLGIWTEHPIAYNYLLNLGQDVPYRLPEGILAGVFVHLIAGGVFFAIASALLHRKASLATPSP